jgi:hypothetical protein
MFVNPQPESQPFFFEKRTKKLLDIGVRLPDRRATGSESRLLLFFRKEDLS